MKSLPPCEHKGAGGRPYLLGEHKGVCDDEESTSLVSTKGGDEEPTSLVSIEVGVKSLPP